MAEKKKFVRRVDEMKLTFMRRNYGEMSLDEVTVLAQQADDFLSQMSPLDIAWKKFKEDSRRWWEYAWLISCEFGSFCPTDPHVKWHNFLIAFPLKQPRIDACDYADWLRERRQLNEGDVCTEFLCALPVYLRPDEVNNYGIDVFHCQNDIEGRLINVEIEELIYPE